MGINANLIPLKEELDFHLEVDTIAEHVTPKTKALLLCNPNNPTGTVLTREELHALTNLAIENDLSVIADEIYLHFVYDDNNFIALSSLKGMNERTFNMISFSKTFSMTGWRLGCTIAPERYLKKAKEIAFLVSPTPATFVHAAGAVALGPCDCWNALAKMQPRIALRKNRRVLLRAGKGLSWPAKSIGRPSSISILRARLRRAVIRPLFRFAYRRAAM